MRKIFQTFLKKVILVSIKQCHKLVIAKYYQENK